jgi:hypothetical protein
MTKTWICSTIQYLWASKALGSSLWRKWIFSPSNFSLVSLDDAKSVKSNGTITLDEDLVIKVRSRLADCTICWERPSATMLRPCGHVCICQECVPTLKSYATNNLMSMMGRSLGRWAKWHAFEISIFLTLKRIKWFLFQHLCAHCAVLNSPKSWRVYQVLRFQVRLRVLAASITVLMRSVGRVEKIVWTRHSSIVAIHIFVSNVLQELSLIKKSHISASSVWRKFSKSWISILLRLIYCQLLWYYPVLSFQRDSIGLLIKSLRLKKML